LSYWALIWHTLFYRALIWHTLFYPCT